MWSLAGMGNGSDDNERQQICALGRLCWPVAGSRTVWLTGVGVIGSASGLLRWIFRSLGRNLTDSVVTRQEHTLIVHGPCRWIRHPLYDAAALFMGAIALIAANWFLCVTGVVVLCVLIIRTRTEEEHLVVRVGDSYRAYTERTGRFLPRIGAPRGGA